MVLNNEKLSNFEDEVRSAAAIYEIPNELKKRAVFPRIFRDGTELT